MKALTSRVLLCLFFGSLAGAVQAYPIDGYEETGIRRLDYVRRVESGEIPGEKQPSGALLPTSEVDLRLTGRRFELPPVDAELSASLGQLFHQHSDRYAIALVDMTDPNNVVYGAFREEQRQNVGSVGKLLAATGFFQALADTYPDDLAARASLLRNTRVVADRFSHSDHHTIRLFDPDSGVLTRRAMRDGDEGNLWEILDWTLSVSSNSAAAMLMREAMLLRQFEASYPLDEALISPFFDETSSADLTALYKQTFWEPVSRNGLSLEELRQGSFFTHEGKRLVNGGGRSYATPRSLIQLALRLEQGRLVDSWSSQQIKRLLYMTERRIRYASAPALRKTAVYFKSGSLYSCEAEEGFKCGPYLGNVRNYMSSLAIIEDDSQQPRIHYAVALLSNVLRENSALAHQALAGDIHQLIRARHQLR